MDIDLSNLRDFSENTKEVDDLLKRLFPICRSITGNGVRKTLSILKEITNFDIHEVSSGTKCYDWIVPDEWNINDAYVKNSSGKKLVSFQENNLHVVNYSIPIDKKMTFNELKNHLHTLKNLPDAIPYITTYYKKDWGFCITYNHYKNFHEDEIFHVLIDSSLKPGSLTYGEQMIKGDSGVEFLFSTSCCHPSLANDNLSGLVLWVLLLRELKMMKTRHTYRFVVSLETISKKTRLNLEMLFSAVQKLMNVNLLESVNIEENS